jgi:hypothetical protein
LDPDARVKARRSGSGGTAGTPGNGLFYFLIDDKEGAEGAVNRRGVWEAVEQVGVEEDNVRSFFSKSLVVFAADGLAEVELPRLKRVSLDSGVTSAF